MTTFLIGLLCIWIAGHVGNEPGCWRAIVGFGGIAMMLVSVIACMHEANNAAN